MKLQCSVGKNYTQEVCRKKNTWTGLTNSTRCGSSAGVNNPIRCGSSALLTCTGWLFYLKIVCYISCFVLCGWQKQQSRGLQQQSISAFWWFIAPYAVLSHRRVQQCGKMWRHTLLVVVRLRVLPQESLSQRFRWWHHSTPNSSKKNFSCVWVCLYICTVYFDTKNTKFLSWEVLLAHHLLIYLTENQ